MHTNVVCVAQQYYIVLLVSCTKRQRLASTNMFARDTNSIRSCIPGRESQLYLRAVTQRAA